MKPEDVFRLSGELRAMCDELDNAAEAGDERTLREHVGEVEVIVHALRDVANGASA